ncbi:MAG TPA: hypothetical protein VG269_17510 [Tepidisphaeraceae bacterium]|jgi:hypothetical protein|nr:hypothetical protein [Tepidisphaeraceae bacterium]
MPQTLPLFGRFASLIRGLPGRDLVESDLVPFKLASGDSVEIFYAPFDWLNLSARVVICGITPGRNSMLLALKTSAAALRAGASHEDAARKGKQTGSFSNMRKNLIFRLDAIGVHVALKLDSTARLFSDRADLLHTTSAVCYPVFKDGENYNGYSPRLSRHPLLKRFITEYLTPEIVQFPRAIFVPNGPAVAEALLMAGVDERRCLCGFPHASNGPGAKDRAAKFEQEREQMMSKVAAWASGSDLISEG